jgi:hypothetical protein
MVIPPDTQGAAGPNHLMVTLNSQVLVQTKNGTPVGTATSLSSFWNNNNIVANNPFDPRVAYDPYGNRWIFTAASDETKATSRILVAVSQTSDPSGLWNLYWEDADSTDLGWADYPQMGFNKDWVVVTVNMFANSNNTFQGAKLFVLSKANLYAGMAATETVFGEPFLAGAPTPAATLDNTLSTLYLVRDWNGGSGKLLISSISGTVGNETYTPASPLATGNIPLGPFVQAPNMNTWADFPPNEADFAPQLGSARKIQNNDSRIMNLVYRNGSLWTTHNVFLPAGAPTRTAVQWWQFPPTGTSPISPTQFGRIDDAGGTIFYAFPTIAVNRQNDALLGYSTFSANQYASANYAFRSWTDPANSFRADTLLKAGEAPYYKTFSGPDNRWGDYSTTVVDPSNDLDFWTIQEYAATPSGGLDRWGTWWGRVSPPRKRLGQITGSN